MNTDDMSMDESKKYKESESKLLQHLKRFESLYNILGHIFVLGAVIVGVVGLYISSSALKATRKAVDLTARAIQVSEKALKVQKEEFYLRNRPIVIVGNVKISGPNASVFGKEFNKTIEFTLFNHTSIPANKLGVKASVIIDGIEVHKTILGPFTTPGGSGKVALAPKSKTTGNIFFKPKDYDEFSKKRKKILVKIIVTYTGILGEEPDKYKSSEELVYEPMSGTFKIVNSDIL